MPGIDKRSKTQIDMDLGSGKRKPKKTKTQIDMDLGSGSRVSKNTKNLKKDMDMGTGKRKAKPSNLQKDMDLGSGTRVSKNTKNLKKDMDLGTGTRKASKTINNKKTSSPKTFGDAFSQARKKQGAGGTFTYKGKKYSTNRADDKKKKKKIDFSKIVSSAKKSRGKKAST